MPTLSDIVREAMAMHESGDVDGAVALFSRLLEAQPGEPIALEYLGVQAAKSGDHERAVSYYQQGLDHPRCRPSMLFQLGHAFRDSGRADEAIEAYGQYLEREPDPAGAVSLADVHFYRQDFKDAEQALLQALDWQPDHVKALCLLAKTEDELGKNESARLHRQKALTAPGDDGETPLLKACAALDLDDPDQAFSLAGQSVNALQGDAFETAIDHFEDEAVWDDLPPVHGSGPPASDAPVLIAVGDPIYVNRFAPDLVRSAVQNSPTATVHIHVIAKETGKDGFTFAEDLPEHSLSWETDSHASKVTFASRRFVRLAQWRRTLNQPLIAIDIDSIVKNDVKDALKALPPFDVAMRHRPEEIFIHQRVAAGFLALAPTESAQVFVDSVAAYIHHFERRRRSIWFVDQMALLAARLRAQDGDAAIRITDVPKPYLDWGEPSAESVIWTAKGLSKSALNQSEF